jgi:hypothetical protein
MALLPAVGLLALAASVPSAQASFDITSFSGSATGPDGDPLTQAAAHPDLTTSVSFATKLEELGQPGPDGNVRDIEVTLPPGVVGDPTATQKCSQADLFGTGFVNECAPETQVGVTTITTYFFGPFEATPGVYNMEPPPGVAAEFGFNIAGTLIFIDSRVVVGDAGYTVESDVRKVSQGLALGNTSVTLWGVPADPSHDVQRFFKGSALLGASSSAPAAPLIRNPTSCTNNPMRTSVRSDSWQEPGVLHQASFDHDPNGNPMVTGGCEAVPFDASIVAQPTTNAADSPTGLEVTVSVAQNKNPRGLGEADLKKAVVTLPAGMAVNPSSASGLGSCSPAQADVEGEAPAACPDDSKIGSVEIDTPLLEHPLHGAVYLAKQTENKFRSLLAIYIAIDDPQTGVVIKLPGKIEADKASGQVTTTFDDNPQVPFEALHVKFFGGQRAPLITPPDCGSYATKALFTPWSETAPVSSSSAFQITQGPNGTPCPSGRFDPKLIAGTTDAVAGHYSPFVLRLSREDGSQRLGSLKVALPAGITGKLAGIPYCPNATLAAVPTAEGTAAAQLASPSCPAASQVGTVSVGAGAGSNPFYTGNGRAYLAGPYKGAPLSLAVVTPALAGPFDLGNVVVRNALEVDPKTARITAVSDPLPTILHGIPLDLRDVRVSVDRKNFTLNPTSCKPMSVDGVITSAQGRAAAVSDRFQVGNCERLRFKPKLSLMVKGGSKRGDYPALKAVLKAKRGQANIARVSVALPHSEFLAQEHINTVCTRVQFAADHCPKGSIYGHARAITPLLDKPLEGPVYLRSSSHPLPDLVVSLHGQIDIELAGRIDSVNGGIRTTFDRVPDAPVSKFVLSMKGGKKGLLVNSRGLCRSTSRADVLIDAQNGKTADQRPPLANGCGKKTKR